MTTSNTGKPSEVTVLDDGEFIITISTDTAPAAAPGFLQVRLTDRDKPPVGFGTIGSFDRQSDGLWRAGVRVHYDESSDSDELVVIQGAQRMDAILMLWKSRRLAVA